MTLGSRKSMAQSVTPQVGHRLVTDITVTTKIVEHITMSSELGALTPSESPVRRSGEVLETKSVSVEYTETGDASYINEYKIVADIGSGAFADVKMGVREDAAGNSTCYAIKVISKSFLKRKREFKRVNGRMVTTNAFEKVEKEVAIMKKLDHDHVVNLVEVIDDPSSDKLYLVLEFVDGGQIMCWDIEKECYCTPDGRRYLTEAESSRLMGQIVQGLEYLHANRIAHRDIKPENILVTNTGNIAKIADFGVAQLFSDVGEDRVKTTEGTLPFLAPEATLGQEFSAFGSDLWSLGITCFAMVSGGTPFHTFSRGGHGELLDAIRTAPIEYPFHVSELCRDFLARLLERNPDSRITLRELKQHPWLGLSSDAVKALPSIVSVTDMDIQLAITPVNNFLMMAKLKLKLGNRLRETREHMLHVKESRSRLTASDSSSSDDLGVSVTPVDVVEARVATLKVTVDEHLKVQSA